MNILFISVYHPERLECPKPSMFSRVWEEVSKKNILCSWQSIDDIQVENGHVIVCQTKEILKPTIIFPFYYSSEKERFAPIVEAFQAQGIICSRQGESAASDKALSAQIFKEKGFLHPKTFYISENIDSGLIEKYLKEMNMRCVFKPTTGKQGEGVHLVHSKEEVMSFLKKYKSQKGYILQELIEPMGRDIRAFVIGGKVIASMERKAPKGELVTNYSKHQTAQKIELSKDEEVLAVNATHVFGLAYAGVDLMRDKKGKTYVLETNARPAIAIEKVTGINIAKAWLEYFLSQQKTPL